MALVLLCIVDTQNEATHTGLTSIKRFTNLNLDMIVLDRVFHISWIWILLSIHYSFLVSKGIHWTHINALKQFYSKIDYIDLKGRFVNLFGNFCPLCNLPCIRSSLSIILSNEKYFFLYFRPMRLWAFPI